MGVTDKEKIGIALMESIQILPDEVVNKIAAGEVVERPSSVVKELVENSLDAKATKIIVELIEGGTRSIVVADNGRGIRKKDIPLTIYRHATSKIETASDLFSINTMGFRGEALAAISSVSKFTLKSRHISEPMGGVLKISNDEELLSPVVDSYDGPSGTIIMVEELFFNVPARSKFLKRASTEYAHIFELIQALSLTNPSVDFVLLHNNKEVFRAYSLDESSEVTENSLRERAKAVFKTDADKLIYVEDKNDYGCIKALISPPGLDRPTSKHIFAFVNGRWVKDKTVRSGIFRGYHGHLLKGRNPLGVIVIEQDPSLVDVNAHPAKTEVRFQYPGEVGALIALAIRSGIRQGGWAKSPETIQASPRADDHSNHSFNSYNQQSRPTSFDAKLRSGDLKFNSAPGVESSIDIKSGAPKTFRAGTLSSSKATFSVPENTKRSIMTFSGVDQNTEQLFDKPVMSSDKNENRQIIPWQELEFIGTFAKCYLVFEGTHEELLLVDQHAFHERILFEKISEDRNLLLQAQPLMIPENISLGAEQVACLQEMVSQLETMSFSFRQISETEVEVTKIPSLLAGKDLCELFSELAEHSWNESGLKANAEIMENILATIACHSAVRSGEILTENEMTQLLTQANSVDFYHNCPHGRRVFRWFKKSEVARWFDRL